MASWSPGNTWVSNNIGQWEVHWSDDYINNTNIPSTNTYSLNFQKAASGLATEYSIFAQAGTGNDDLLVKWNNQGSGSTVHGLRLDPSLTKGLQWILPDNHLISIIPAGTSETASLVLQLPTSFPGGVTTDTIATVSQFNSPPNIGSVTANGGRFTTLQVSGTQIIPANSGFEVNTPLGTNVQSSAQGRVMAIDPMTLIRAMDTGTYALSAVNSIGQVTLTAGADSTYTIACVWCSYGAAIAGTHVTITNDYDIYAQGNNYFDSIQLGGALKPLAARKGTFVCSGGGTITITNANEQFTSDVIISLNTAGGTITTPPAMKTVTASTGFSVLCGATDSSTYNYDILN